MDRRGLAIVLACAACSSETFAPASGGSDAALDAATDSTTDVAVNDLDASAKDAKPGDAAADGNTGVNIKCGAATCTKGQACCFEADGGSPKCVLASDCALPKLRYLCDDREDCLSGGNTMCCAQEPLNSDTVYTSYCAVSCNNTEWRFCDPTAATNECIGDTVQGESCKVLNFKTPVGLYACQE